MARIVLTASPVEMSDFNLNPFVAFSAGFPFPVPLSILRRRIYPAPRINPDGTAVFAPYGLRKVESLLVDRFGEEDVKVVHPYYLDRHVTSETRVVGISTMDPMGIGFVSRTYTSILRLNGKPVTRREFEWLLRKKTLRKCRPKIVVGGSGAWQIPVLGLQEKLGVDLVVLGQAEAGVVDIFEKLLNGENIKGVVEVDQPELKDIPPIRNPSLYGTVEVTRGCGRGCSFCSPNMRRRISIPLEMVLKEASLNLKAGSRMILLQTEDIYLYGSKGFKPNRESLMELFSKISELEGLEYIQVAHAALAPAAWSAELTEMIGEILIDYSLWRRNGEAYATFEVGIETGSPRLMKKYMAGKPKPYSTEEWPKVVKEAIITLNSSGIYPLATIIIGMPGERVEDAVETLKLVEELDDQLLFYVPLLFTAERNTPLENSRNADTKALAEVQWEIIGECWRQNIDKWAQNKASTIKLAAKILFQLYYRWKHGEALGKALDRLIS